MELKSSALLSSTGIRELKKNDGQGYENVT